MIEFYVSDKHEVKCNACFIGRTGENEAEEIRVIVPECVCDKWLYLDFEKPDGTKFKTPRIDIVDGVGSYMLGGNLVDTAGMLKVEAVLQDETGVCWKSEKKEYYVSKSINATEEIAEANPDFIAEAQKVLDEIEGITNETDPTVPQHVKNITEENIANWNKVENVENVLRDILVAIEEGRTATSTIEEIEQIIVSYFEDITVGEVEE
jgi:hypothetical protein